MTLKLGDYVVAGELFNTRPYKTHGWLALQGEDRPLLLDLTGDCSPDLAGKHIRFSLPDDRPPPPQLEPQDAQRLAWQQVGPTGEMTIRLVPPQGAPEAAPKPYLRLQWRSQNGAVEIELFDPVLEFVDDEAEAAREAAEAASAGPATDEVQPSTEQGQDEVDDEANLPLLDEDEVDDPYGLFPPGLDDELADEGDDSELPDLLKHENNQPPGESQERNWRDVIPGIDEETAQLYESWDEVLDGKHDVAFRELFDPPLKLLTAEQLAALSDAEAETAFKDLLARLALHGVQMSMCEHFTPRTTYRLLVDEILPENGISPQAPALGFVEGYMTSEMCPQCEAEFDRKWEEERRERGDD